MILKKTKCDFIRGIQLVRDLKNQPTKYQRQILDELKIEYSLGTSYKYGLISIAKMCDLERIKETLLYINNQIKEENTAAAIQLEKLAINKLEQEFSYEKYTINQLSEMINEREQRYLNLGTLVLPLELHLTPLLRTTFILGGKYIFTLSP